MSILILTPGQSTTVLGAELTGLGGLLVTAVTISAVRSHLPVTNWRWTALTILLALVSTVPMLVAGVSLVAGAGGGLYWAVAEIVLGFAVAVYYAWILLVEILR
ncbi:MAG: hypothetical protein M3P23_01475 [Actinomycetota bacterium]|nr:hypothetical protein [Actinomycetota bacterium]